MTAVTRDKNACLSRLVVAEDGRVLARAPCRIQVPERWMSVGLGNIGEVTSVYGFFPILFDDDVYGVMNVCAMMDLTPSRTTTVTIDEETYYEFHFDENSSVIRTLSLIRQDTLTFTVMDELMMKGKVPWWATVDDLCSVFDTADKHADSRIGKIPQTIEFLVGVTARRIEERAKSLRHTAESWDDFKLDRIEFIPLKSVFFAVNNTVSKLSGAHFASGVVSAITNPSSKTSKVEKILRS